MRRSVIPGFGLSLGITLLYLGAIVLLPLAALILKASDIGAAQLWAILSSPRTLAAIRLTLTMALVATLFNALYGTLLAWVLARYTFPGKRLLDALIDVPFALPTAVAGLALTALFSKSGWFGAPLDALGLQIVYTPLGIAIAMAFTSIPFVVRTVQPVIEDLGSDVEEASRSLGANDLQILSKIILPSIFPALLAGASLAFARSLGEFGAVIFIAGNQPMKTEIVALLAFIRLEEYDYPAAAAIASAMLVMAFVMLIITNAVQAWQLRYLGKSGT
ncbi:MULTISPECIES: sulfate ABC transporter permease subunit CysT [Rhodopseudomonas]|uniref:Sulfate transport system permease protein CysT n=1 Tax=Rhodopseudomonas palustris (strain DX-1) TaxID=652103 RepID=E6VPK6_RHOPX|nr:MULTISPECIES: sulfate ABC transporter permease subunit CysT [Rhodopseudomonas]NEW88380.1 sulfate ABC transporter permease subunit CysT [Rhodopseudomonas sp. WA056]QDL98777.1 sulfate ABC transporter permease subunit CysT [Rhodopseudomonas palustris]